MSRATPVETTDSASCAAHYPSYRAAKVELRWRPIDPCTHDEPWCSSSVDWGRAAERAYHLELAQELRHREVVPIWTDAHCVELADLFGWVMLHCTWDTPEFYRDLVVKQIMQAEVAEDGHVIWTRETPMDACSRAHAMFYRTYDHTPDATPQVRTPPTVPAPKRRRITQSSLPTDSRP